MAMKYVPVSTVAECRAAASAGLLYWYWGADDGWRNYSEDSGWALNACDASWKHQLRVFQPSILVEDDDDG